MRWVKIYCSQFLLLNMINAIKIYLFDIFDKNGLIKIISDKNDGYNLGD